MKVFYNNILIEIVKETESKIIIPDSVKSENRPQTRKCKIVGIGDGFYNPDSTECNPLLVKVGDIVYMQNDAWTQVKHNGKTHLIADVSSVVARVEEGD